MYDRRQWLVPAAYKEYSVVLFDDAESIHVVYLPGKDCRKAPVPSNCDAATVVRQASLVPRTTRQIGRETSRHNMREGRGYPRRERVNCNVTARQETTRSNSQTRRTQVS